MHTKIVSVLLGSVLMLGIVGLTTANAFAQTFDITTQQEGQGEAVITVQLATNNTVVIPPNGTIIEVPGNITQVDNDTVVITPDNETVTELPGNITVITSPEPEPCGCPEVPPAAAGANETGPPIEPVIVTPAPGQEVITENGTELIANESQEEPIPIPPEQGNETVIIDEGGLVNDTAGIAPGSNESQRTDEGGEAAEPEPPAEQQEGNDTGLSPAASFAKMLPWWET